MKRKKRKKYHSSLKKRSDIFYELFSFKRDPPLDFFLTLIPLTQLTQFRHFRRGFNHPSFIPLITPAKNKVSYRNFRTINVQNYFQLISSYKIPVKKEKTLT